jgi:hypothetical protein
LPCVDRPRLFVRRTALAILVFILAACADQPVKVPATPTRPGSPSVSSTSPMPSNKHGIKLPAPESPRSWADARQQAARRLVAANPDGTYTSKPPDILMAIPVLTVELNGDGSVRQISVMRYPSQARETVEMAMAAVKRAAPFGDVSRLPKPWKFNETFLFNEDYKFKPMTLDQR